MDLGAEAFLEDAFEAGDALVHLVEAFLEVCPDIAELVVVAGADVVFDLFGCVDFGHIVVWSFHFLLFVGVILRLWRSLPLYCLVAQSVSCESSDFGESWRLSVVFLMASIVFAASWMSSGVGFVRRRWTSCETCESMLYFWYCFGLLDLNKPICCPDVDRLSLHSLCLVEADGREPKLTASV